MPYLSSQVRNRRYAELREAMERERLDAVAISSADFFFFFTNYPLDVRPWERPVFLVIPYRGEPFAIMHELSRNGLALAAERGTLWLEEFSFYSEHIRNMHRLPLRPALGGFLVEQLRDRGFSEARIGYDVAPAEEDVLNRAFPQLQWVDATHELRRLRWVKTEEELELARANGALTDFGQTRFRAGLRAGRFIQELDASIIAEVTAEACVRFPGEDFSMRLHSWCGPMTAAPHGGPRTGLRIEEGHVVVNILTARLNGIEVENERTWFVGTPSDRQVECFEATRQANEAGAAMLVEGNRVCDIDSAAQEVFERAGLGEFICHRTGHGMGTVRHEFPEDMPFNTRRLLAGEMYSVEPGIYLPGLGGFRQDDTVIVGISGPERVTHAASDIGSQTVSAR